MLNRFLFDCSNLPELKHVQAGVQKVELIFVIT